MKYIYLKKVVSIFLVALLLNHLPSFAQSVVFGACDCGQWLRDSKTRSANEAWAMGYLSGMNASNTTVLKKDWLNKLNSSEQAFVYLDNYCQKNPLKSIQVALNILVFELNNK